MKYCYTLLLLLGLTLSLSASDFERGYLVTKNGMRLTGFLGVIQHSVHKSAVVFVNDFGTPYTIEPERVRGFVIQRSEGFVAYESKYDRSRWLFLKVIYKGDGMNLYKAPELRQEMVISSMGFSTRTFTTHEYYLEIKGRTPFKLKRWGFRKRMRRLLRPRAPKLSEKIGAPGYRYNDLEKIVREFNDEFLRTQYQL